MATQQRFFFKFFFIHDVPILLFNFRGRKTPARALVESIIGSFYKAAQFEPCCN